MQTEKCGWGLKADEDIRAGAFLIEYVGEGKLISLWCDVSRMCAWFVLAKIVTLPIIFKTNALICFVIPVHRFAFTGRQTIWEETEKMDDKSMRW